MKQAIILVTILALSGCNKDSDSVRGNPVLPNNSIQSDFKPPTAEEAYRLQDDCTRKGERIKQENLIGSALTEDAVARYSPRTNRCYVRLDVNSKDLSQWDKFDVSSYLYDGQSKELLAYVTTRPSGERAFLGFNCSPSNQEGVDHAGFFCVANKIAECMKGKECDPD